MLSSFSLLCKKMFLSFSFFPFKHVIIAQNDHWTNLKNFDKDFRSLKVQRQDSFLKNKIEFIFKFLQSCILISPLTLR